MFNGKGNGEIFCQRLKMRLDEIRSDETCKTGGGGGEQINRKCETQESNVADINLLVLLSLFWGVGEGVVQF